MIDKILLAEDLIHKHFYIVTHLIVDMQLNAAIIGHEIADKN